MPPLSEDGGGGTAEKPGTGIGVFEGGDACGAGIVFGATPSGVTTDRWVGMVENVDDPRRRLCVARGAGAGVRTDRRGEAGRASPGSGFMMM